MTPTALNALRSSGTFLVGLYLEAPHFLILDLWKGQLGAITDNAEGSTQPFCRENCVHSQTTQKAVQFNSSQPALQSINSVLSDSKDRCGCCCHVFRGVAHQETRGAPKRGLMAQTRINVRRRQDRSASTTTTTTTATATTATTSTATPRCTLHATVTSLAAENENRRTDN